MLSVFGVLSGAGQGELEQPSLRHCCGYLHGLGDGFVPRGGTESAPTGTWKEHGLDRSAISLP